MSDPNKKVRNNVWFGFAWKGALIALFPISIGLCFAGIISVTQHPLNERNIDLSRQLNATLVERNETIEELKQCRSDHEIFDQLARACAGMSLEEWKIKRGIK
jgi:hypothetical protein